MQQIKQLILFIAVWLLLMNSVSLSRVATVNGTLQILLFVFVVCIPTWRTGRMSYVDIGWPWGLVVIGGVTFMMAAGDATRVSPSRACTSSRVGEWGSSS